MRWLLLAVVLAGSPAYAQFRIGLGTEFIHGQGYWSPSLRIGEKWGLRIGALNAPVWAESVPENIQRAKPQFDLESHMYFGIDREFCGSHWCGGLGVVRINGLSYMNGTRYNFGVYGRYKIDKHWSIEYTHFSHGAALGIAEEKSNRGWNLIGLSYAW